MRKYALWIALVGLSLAGCDVATPVDPKPAGPIDTRLKPADGGKSSPAGSPAVRGE